MELEKELLINHKITIYIQLNSEKCDNLTIQISLRQLERFKHIHIDVHVNDQIHFPSSKTQLNLLEGPSEYLKWN